MVRDPNFHRQEIDTGELGSSEEIRYGYDRRGRIKSVRKVSSDHDKMMDDLRHSRCWVVTAYYGDPFDKHVAAIRELRTILACLPCFGKAILMVNQTYLRIGATHFASFWVNKTAPGKKNIARLLSSIVCQTLYGVARIVLRHGFLARAFRK